MSQASTFELLLRLTLSLGVVIGLMWAVSAVLKKRGLLGSAPRRARPGLDVEVLARRPVGKGSSVAVVRAAGHAFVIGITDHTITKLADADIDAIEIESADAHWTAQPQGITNPTSAWKTMLEQLRERTVRR